MVYKLIETGEMGPFTKDGSYYDIYEAINVMTPQGANVGWDHFNSLDEAAMAYGVTRVPEPEPVEEETDEVINNEEC